MKASLVLASALIISSAGISAPGGWHDRNGDRFRAVQGFDLGTIRIGSDSRRNDSERVEIDRNPRIQCNLTHVRLTSLNDTVRILALEVEYARTNRFGQAVDRIDLNDSDDFRRWGGRGDGRGWGRRHRMNRGIELSPGESSPLLDLDDVQDGFPEGRCVKSIRVIGFDAPDLGHFGHGRGMGGGRPPIGRFETPAFVKMEGFLLRVGHGEDRRDGGRGDNRWDGRGEDHNGRRGDDRGGFNPPVPAISTEPFGTTGIMDRTGGERILGVGPQKGSFRGIKIMAKDDQFQVLNITIEFMNDQRVSFSSMILRENEEQTLMFSHDMRRDSRASLIKRVIILGQTPIMARSRSQLHVSGIRAN